MKHVINIIVLSCLFAFSNAQEIKYTYCEIVGTSNLMRTKVTIVVDYGDQVKITKPNWIRNSEGDIQKFNSMIDALNYMGDQGWEFVQAFAVSIGNGGQHVYHYILKRENTDSNTD